MINYIHISLWIVCFFDALILLCLPTSERVSFSTDGSAARFAVDILCLLIGVSVLFQNGWKKLPNKTLGLLLGLMVLSHFHCPNIQFESSFLPHDHAIFNYKPMFEALLFFIMFMGMYSMNLNLKIEQLINKSLVLIAVLYGALAVLQRFGLDQLYVLAGSTEHMSRNPEVGGFISQPVFCAALIAICMPFVMRYGNIFQLVICLAGILATGNRSALIVVLICFLFSISLKRFGQVVLGVYISYLVLGVVFQFTSLHVPHLQEERFYIWKQIIEDFSHPLFPGINTSQILTGTGLGSFPVIFPFYHHNGYYQAHNELLEAVRGLGIVGLALLVNFIWRLPKSDSYGAQPIRLALLSSLLLALTNAIWHIPQLAFLTVFLVALSYNKNTGVNYVQ